MCYNGENLERFQAYDKGYCHEVTMSEIFNLNT